MPQHSFSGAAAAEQMGSLHPSWPAIEACVASVCAGASLAAILFSKLNLPFRCVKDDFVMRNSFKILKQIKGVLNLPRLSNYALICQNPCFPCPKLKIFWDDIFHLYSVI